jgi:hypothetical protein
VGSVRVAHKATATISRFTKKEPHDGTRHAALINYFNLRTPWLAVISMRAANSSFLFLTPAFSLTRIENKKAAEAFMRPAAFG